jgi:hypothetical protein
MSLWDLAKPVRFAIIALATDRWPTTNPCCSIGGRLLADTPAISLARFIAGSPATDFAPPTTPSWKLNWRRSMPSDQEPKDVIARGVLEKHGLADAFLHSLGHGIGLNIHEGPRLAEDSVDTLEPGMIVTVEPGVYFGGDFGIRIEDDVLVTQDGAEVITSLPKGLDDCRLML